MAAASTCRSLNENRRTNDETDARSARFAPLHEPPNPRTIAPFEVPSPEMTVRDDVFPIGAATRIALGETTLDLTREQLEDVAGMPIDLRPQAFAVLRHLASNAGRLVGKEELFAAVWPNVVVTDDSLVQAIGDVRRALGAGGQRIIKTIPRRGYMLIADAVGAEVRARDVDETTGPSPQAHDSKSVESTPPARTPRRFAWTLLMCLALAATVLAWRFLPFARAPGPVPMVMANPTLSVLPFETVSVVGDRTWIGDALSIGIASALARLSNLPVLLDRTARGTGAASANRKVPPSTVQATHVLAGSVQSDAQRVRVTIHLTEAGSGRVLWSEHYDRPLERLFALQDEITANTVTALQVRLVEGEQARSRTHPNGNLKAWELATLGYLRFETGGPAPLAEARQLFEQTLALDPDYAWARSYLAATCFLEARFGFALQPELSMQRAFEEATRAVAIDPGLPDAQATLGSVQLARRQYDEAVASGRRAIALGPNDAEIHAVLAQTMLAIGEWERAVELSRKAIQLTSRPPSWYYVPQTYGLVYLGRFDEAAAAGERMSELAESPFMRRAARLGIVFADVEAGRVDAARAIVDERKPLQDRGAERVAARLLFKDARDAERLSRSLERAGVPR